jgi:hypothetical protein
MIYGSGAIRKNNRPSLVCTNCRRRKVKCDRKLPCTRCVKSKLTDTCSYDSILDFNALIDGDCNNLSSNLNDNYDNIINNNDNIDDNNNDNNSNNNNIDIDINSDTARNSFESNSTSAYTRYDSPLFNYKTLEYKKPLFTKDDNSVSYESPLTLDSISNNNLQFSKFRNIMSYLFASKEIDVYSKKLHDDSNLELKLLYDIYSKETIDEYVEHIILPNINAVNERLFYFNRDLKNKTLCVLLPVDDLIALFNKIIIPDINNPGTFIYNHNELKNKTDYSIFACILGILRVVLTITEYDETIKFNYKLNINYEKLTELTLKFLSFSNYKLKPNFNLLLGFLLYRMSYFLTDSVVVNSNAGIFFDISVNIAYKLGIHIDCNQIKGTDEDLVRGVWNLLQLIDSITGVHTGELSKIDYRYCVPSLYEHIEPFVLFFRQIVSLLNSVSPISLNDIIELAETSSRLLSVFKNFNELLFSEPKGPIENLFSIVLKSDLIICFQTLLLVLRFSIDDINKKVSIKINDQDLLLVEEYKERTEIQLFYTLVLSFDLIRKVSNGKMSNYLQSVRLTISLRLLFSKFLAINNKIIFSYLSVFKRHQLKDKLVFKNNINNNNNNNIYKKFSDITLQDTETYILKGLDNICKSDTQFENMAELMTSLPLLSDYLMEFYISISDKTVLILSGRFSIHFKILLFLCILLKNTHEYIELKSHEIENYHFKFEDWKQVMDNTTSFFTHADNDTNGINQMDNELRFFGSDWDFLQSAEIQDTLAADSEFEGLYQMFFG